MGVIKIIKIPETYNKPRDLVETNLFNNHQRNMHYLMPTRRQL
jgi:hypothetical protein